MYNDDEFLTSDSMGAAPVSPLVMDDPATGIGLTADLSGGEFSTVGAGMSAPSAMSERDQYRNSLSPTQRIGLGFLNFSRGSRGQTPYEDEVVTNNRRDRLAKLQEFKIVADSLDDGVKMLHRLQGNGRTQFIEQYAKNLDSVSPGAGNAFRSLASQPDMGATLTQHADKSPTLRRALDAGGPAAVVKLLSSPEALKTINAEIDSSVMPGIIKKVQSFKMGWQQLVPPEMAQRFNKDGRITASELMEANEWVKANKPDMKALVLTDDELQVVNRNAEAFYGSVGILSPKDEATVTKDRLKKEDDAPKTRTITQGTTEIQQEWRDGKWTEVGRGPKFKPSGGGSDGKVIADRNTELKLADDYARDTKGFKDVKTQFSSITDYMAGKKYTSAGDRSLIFAYAKMNDPGDKVAVRDIQDIEKLGNVPERFVQAVKGLATGTELPPRIRNDMYAEIKRKFGELNTAQQDTERDYGDRAGRYGLDTRNVVRPLSVKADQPKVGETVSRGGKKWKVVGHDKDGEPLVEEVK